MNEMEVAEQVRDGVLPSPALIGDLALFALRVTGTGAAFRSSINEYVWRDPSLYLNDDFLKRCNGVPVIWEHPERLSLNSEEFSARVIGSLMLPYIKGDEVWSVARIYDSEAIRLMSKGQLSTSPSVVFKNSDGNKTGKLEDGTSVLIEAEPSLLCHLAVCAAGVWDKGGPPTGVLNSNEATSDSTSSTPGAGSMTDEEKAAAAAARKDADAGEKLDKLLTHMDSLHTRMDAMEMADKARKDAAEAKEKTKADYARKDRASRMDAEHEGWMKSDEVACKTDDAEEFAEKKKLMEEGEPEEVAADKARSSRKDRMTARADKARKDSEDGEEEERRKKKEAEAAKNDAARADSASTARELADVRAKLAALEAITRPIPEADRQPYVDEQVRADAVYQAFGQRAPSPLGGETVNGYRLRLTKGMQKYSRQWKPTDLNIMVADATAFKVVQDQIYADAVVASRTPDGLAPGQLLPRVHVNPETGQRVTTFVGNGTFIGAMRRAPRRARINNFNRGA